MKKGGSRSSGLIVAGLQSGTGKTAVACLLLAALQARKVPLQAFKVGPDFLDPGYHAYYAGSASRNLDAWMMGEEGLIEETARFGAGRLSVVEGVMGLFDGGNARSDEGSTMALARLLHWPVILVVPCAKVGRSIVAAVRGYLAEAGKGRIVGLILNEVSGPAHEQFLREALEELALPILGALPRLPEMIWPERYLGLQASSETELASPDALARLAEKHLDLERLLDLASPSTAIPPPSAKPSANRRRIALARDQAFHFYYETNLDMLRQNGIELVEFSPLADRSLPRAVDGMILGGGFPEIFAERLAANRSLKAEVRDAIEKGLPCYAECGGLMYLAQELIASDGKRHPMVGVIPGAIEMTRQLNHFGYCSAKTEGGATFRGHEFHHSRWLQEAEHANLWSVTRKRTGTHRREGYRYKNLHASYVHLHFLKNWPCVEALFGPRPLAAAAKTLREDLASA